MPKGLTPRLAALRDEIEGHARAYGLDALKAKLAVDETAAKELEKSIRLNDMRLAAMGERILQGDASAKLGSALHALGRDREARAAYERAIRDDPSGKANYQLLLKQLGKP